MQNPHRPSLGFVASVLITLCAAWICGCGDSAAPADVPTTPAPAAEGAPAGTTAQEAKPAAELVYYELSKS